MYINRISNGIHIIDIHVTVPNVILNITFSIRTTFTSFTTGKTFPTTLNNTVGSNISGNTNLVVRLS